MSEHDIKVIRERMGDRMSHLSDDVIIGRYQLMLEPYNGNYEAYLKAMDKTKFDFNIDDD